MFILTQPHLAPQKRRPNPNNKRLLSSIHTLLYNDVFVLILNTLNLEKISEDNLGQYTVKLPWNTAEAAIYRQTFQIIRGRQKTIKQLKQLFLSLSLSLSFLSIYYCSLTALLLPSTLISFLCFLFLQWIEVKQNHI